MISAGVVGSTWRARVAPSGAVLPDDGGAPLRWLIAADDRWHDPETEVAVRQQRRHGTPVVDTRVRVPNGDIGQTVWSVADHGGLTLVEFRNESPLPVAIALTRRDVLTSRAPASTAVAGIDAPADSLVLPLGHRASVTVALAHDGRGGGPLPATFADAETVASAWVGRTDAASRLELPSPELAEHVRALRCELMLAGVDHAIAREPARALVALNELWRLAELNAAMLDEVIPDVAAAAEAVLRGAAEPATGAALRAAAALFAAADEQRAGADLRRGVGRLTVPPPPEFAAVAGDDPLLIPAVESAICADGVLFAGGIPSGWAGQNFEAHGIPAGDASVLSLAVRWHGHNPAVLWEVTGDPVVLSSPLASPPWQTSAPTGEALLVLADAS